MELQRGRIWQSWKARIGCMGREQEQREEEHRKSAETGVRNCVMEVTQAHKIDQSVSCRFWQVILDRGLHPRGPT